MKHLDHLAGREDELWREVEAFIDLRDLSVRDGSDNRFATQLSGLRDRYAKRRPGLLERLNRAGLKP